MSSVPDDRAVEGVRAAIADAVGRLAAAGARDEALARFVPARKTLLITRAATMESIGRVWRLGALLLNAGGELFATGSITRVTEPGRPAYQSVSAETRRAYRAAAVKGGFALGDTVNYDAVPIPLDAEHLRSGDGPLLLREGRVLVRWSASAPDDAAVELRQYLQDRVGLLIDPPAGA